MTISDSNNRPSQEDIREWLDRIRKSGAAIVVEGSNDKKALMALGLQEERILTLNRDAIFAIAEDIAEKFNEVIILTDLDKEGKTLYSKLAKNFERNGIRVDRFFRNFLFKTEVSHIEGLDSYIERILFQKV